MENALRSGSASAWTQTSHEIWKSRVAPVEGILSKCTGLLVIPSGPMLGVPLEILVDDQGTYLAERFDIRYTPSAGVWTKLREQVSPSIEPSVVCIGAPSQDAFLVADVATSGGILSSKLALAVTRGNEESIDDLPPLPGSLAEVEAVAQCFDRAKVLIGHEATEPAIDELFSPTRAEKPSIIHIATHALVDSEFPENSSLVVAPPPAHEASALYDRRITSEEILANWHLNAELVTLSACETGLGAELPGEGFIGFTDAFLAAGASRLLVSLWPVDDQATRLLMERFYTRWIRDGQTCSKALRDARHDVRSFVDALGRTPYEHPMYWGSFILIGG